MQCGGLFIYISFSLFSEVKLFLETGESLQLNSLNVRGDLSH